jgi:hypothetical protein
MYIFVQFVALLLNLTQVVLQMCFRCILVEFQ